MAITKDFHSKNSKGRKNPVKPSVRATRPWGPNSQMLQTIGTKRVPRGRNYMNGEGSKNRTPILLSDNEEPVSYKRRKQEPLTIKPKSSVNAKAPVVIDLTEEDDESRREVLNERSRQTSSSDLFFPEPPMQPEMVTSVLDKPELVQDRAPVRSARIPLAAEGEISDQQQQQPGKTEQIQLPETTEQQRQRPGKTEQKPQLENELQAQVEARRWIAGVEKEIAQHQKNIQKYEGWQQEVRREHPKSPSKLSGWSANRVINAEKTLMEDKEHRLEELRKCLMTAELRTRSVTVEPNSRQIGKNYGVTQLSAINLDAPTLVIEE